MKLKKYRTLIVISMQLLVLYSSETVCGAPGVWTYRQGALHFRWDLLHDRASVLSSDHHARIWQGSLLPSFWLEVNGERSFVKARVINLPAGSDSMDRLRLELQIGSLGRGHLIISKESWGIRFSEFDVEWFKQPPAIIEMYFGASDETVRSSLVWPTWSRPFMPDWQSLLFCVPGAKEGTPQSYFRMWDFGQAGIALGSFGPSMGTPYGAAYPRPLYYAGMGSDEGFIAFGAGSIPDAAMSLRVGSTRGCFQYVYDENLWGALPGRKRTWKEPLRITLGINAWQAFKRYYRSFAERQRRPAASPRVCWNTWGMWKQGEFPMRPIADFAKSVGAEVLVMDDGWESSEGSGIPDLVKFPHFYQDLDESRKDGLDIGLWESVGWMAAPFSQGLKTSDLILDRKGRPCKANWNFDPAATSFYCLDISSARARKYIRQRTLRLMKTIRPAVLKLDFTYGLPAPSMGVPRDPGYRGERFGFQLFHLIATTAKSVDPNVRIQGFSISPLWLQDEDIVSMDDQGDLWYDIAGGHQRWSLWASLLSDQSVRVCGSSGYKWQKDDEVVLNTAILGVPGAVLPIRLTDGKRVPNQYFDRRLAIDHWYRPTLNWTPLWLNSRLGGYTVRPELHCWGRLEKQGKSAVLTALVLRKGDTSVADAHANTNVWRLNDPETAKVPMLRQLRWKGRWALISQDNKDIFSTAMLAVIPFDAGVLSLPYAARPAGVTRLDKGGEKAFSQWKWSKGQLRIQVSASVLSETAGFLIKRDEK